MRKDVHVIYNLLENIPLHVDVERYHTMLLVCKFNILRDTYSQVSWVEWEVRRAKHYFVLVFGFIGIHVPRSASGIIVSIYMEGICINTLAPHCCISYWIRVVTSLKPPLLFSFSSFNERFLVKNPINSKIWHSVVKPNIHYPLSIIM